MISPCGACSQVLKSTELQLYRFDLTAAPQPDVHRFTGFVPTNLCFQVGKAADFGVPTRMMMSPGSSPAFCAALSGTTLVI